MHGPTTMTDEELEKKIDSTIIRLTPLFQAGIYPKPDLRREEKWGLSISSRPCYNWEENYFYFPQEPDMNPRRTRTLLSDATINHEVSHFLHFHISPQVWIWRKSNEKPAEEHNALEHFQEHIAEFPNFIIGMNEDINEQEKYWYNKPLYDYFGPSALPLLARMSIDDIFRSCQPFLHKRIYV
jgi:hypothetical protein